MMTEFEIKKSSSIAVKHRNKMFRRLGRSNKTFKDNLVVIPEEIAVLSDSIIRNPKSISPYPYLRDGIGGCKLLSINTFNKLPGKDSPIYGKVPEILNDLVPFKFEDDGLWRNCYIFRSYDELIKTLVRVLTEKGLLNQ